MNSRVNFTSDPDCQSQNSKSSVQLFCTLGSLLVLYVSLLFFMRIPSAALAMMTAVAIGILNVRIFNLMHDCCHDSLFTNRKLNRYVGVILATLTLTPFYYWRHHHLKHHGASGNLDRRGHGDILLYTVEEYKKLDKKQQFFYQAYRHPFVFLIIGPIYYFVIKMRNPYLAKPDSQQRRNIVMVNIVWMAIYAGLYVLKFDVWHFFLLHMLSALIGGSIGLWLFYVQHQYEEAYWKNTKDWKYHDAAYKGSSYLELPRLIEWLFVHINIHHIHHADPRVPNYGLKQAMNSLPVDFSSVRKLNLGDALTAFKFKLWDEDKEIMTGFPE